MKSKNTELYTFTITSKINTLGLPKKYTKVTLGYIKDIIHDVSNLREFKVEGIKSINDISHHIYKFEVTPTEVSETPKLIEPTDTWTPRRRHTKELFEGYFRAKYSKVPDFMEMYNAGIKILQDAGQPVYLEYLENFMNLMIKRHHPDVVIGDSIQPRFYEVMMKNDDSTNEEIMPFSKIMKLWPHITNIIEKPDFRYIYIENSDGESLRIKKYFKVNIPVEEK